MGFNFDKVFYPTGFNPDELVGIDLYFYLEAAIGNLFDGKIKKILIIYIRGGYDNFQRIECDGDYFDEESNEESNEKIPLRTDFKFNFEDFTIHDFYYLASQIVDFHDSFFNWDEDCLMKKEGDDEFKINLKRIIEELKDKIDDTNLPKTKNEDNPLDRNIITRSIIMLVLKAIENRDCLTLQKILDLQLF